MPLLQRFLKLKAKTFGMRQQWIYHADI